MITCHVIAPPHTWLTKHVWSTCAITQRTLTLIKALKTIGYYVIDYSNCVSESCADEKVEILNSNVCAQLVLRSGEPGDPHPEIERAFMHRLDQVARPRGNDVVMHTYGRRPGDVFMKTFEAAVHVEPGVGYDRPPWGPYRIYESEAWRHFLWGKYGTSLNDRRKSWVIPWAFDPTDWPEVVGATQSYVSFLGRIVFDKGLETVKAGARALPSVRFCVAGPGNPGNNWPSNVELIGPVYGRERVAFLSGAFAHLCPTEYVEPLGGSAIEAMLCGTPVIASDYGGFTETIVDGVTGYRASTPREWIHGVERASKLDRSRCRASALERFGLDAAAPKYRRAIEQLLTR